MDERSWDERHWRIRGAVHPCPLRDRYDEYRAAAGSVDRWG